MEKMRVYLSEESESMFVEEFSKSLSTELEQHVNVVNANATGQDIFDTLSTLVISMGGGYGIGQIIKPLGDAIEKCIKANKSTIEINVDGKFLKLENANVDKIMPLLDKVLNNQESNN